MNFYSRICMKKLLFFSLNACQVPVFSLDTCQVRQNIYSSKAANCRKVFYRNVLMCSMLVFDIPSMNTRREKCPYSELYWSIFSRIRTKYREILSIFPYLVRMRENTDENNSEYRHFLHCDTEAVAQRWSLKKLL